MNDPSMNMRLVKFAGNAVRFDVDHPGLLAVVDVHFAHCFGVDETILADYQVRAEGEAFSILRDGNPFQSNINFEHVLLHLMQDGLTQLNGAPNMHLVFHAAAVAYQGRGLLLCGKSGSGKSTLTAWLTAKGFQYLTDEVVAVPVSGEELDGFGRSLVLKRGSAFVWEKLPLYQGEKGFLRLGDGSAWIVPTLLNPAALPGRVEPQLILFPTYFEGAGFKAEPLTAAKTLFELMQCLVNARNFSDHGMERTKRLAQRVTAYRIVYSDVEEAYGWIRRTLNA